MVLVLDKIKKWLFGFHNLVERFFEAREKEANGFRATSLFTIAVLLISSWIVASEYKWDPELLSLALSSTFSLVLGSFLGSIVMAVFIFLTGGIFLHYVGKYCFNSKSSLSQVVYIWSIPLMLFGSVPFLAFLLGSIYPSLAYLSLFVYIIEFYFVLVGLKVVHNLEGYWQAFLLLIIANIGVGIVMIVFVPVFFWLAALTSPDPSTLKFVFNITNNSDGSFTASYTSISKRTDKTMQECNITFPKGWKQGDEMVTTLVLEKEYGGTYDENDKKRVFYNNDDLEPIDQYIFLRSTPLSGIPFKKCEMETSEFNKNFTVEEVKYKLIKQNFLEICDTKGVNKKITRHFVSGGFMNGKGFDMVYETQNKEDKDLYFILESMKCYKQS